MVQLRRVNEGIQDRTLDRQVEVILFHDNAESHMVKSLKLLYNILQLDELFNGRFENFQRNKWFFWELEQNIGRIYSN